MLLEVGVIAANGVIKDGQVAHMAWALATKCTNPDRGADGVVYRTGPPPQKPSI